MTAEVAPEPRAEPVRREFVTPEGVDLGLKVATYAERVTALGIDLAILAGAMIVLTLLVIAAAAVARSAAPMEMLGVVWVIGSSLGRYIYFLAFELGPRAATPGKRIMGLRVIAADGGRLTADAVFARNAMREVEVFLPILFALSQGQGIDGVMIALGLIWSGVFALFPLFNRDRRRLGDLAAGALVVKVPRLKLQVDLADVERTGAQGVVFAPAQLDVYGIRELHVLEDVLRGGDRKAIAEVAARIRAKIGWDGAADMADRTFLNAYYAALRGRLENRLLFGQRRRDKFDVS
ncbi:MAG: RDD family protein [Phenylobacterium sp.]|uniref:RDD family protein n=1 Tax=Phenylobacterium sp. TaxID=1871053 RepID=UPI0025F87C8B|nr:RDD family protein [Phenylobacterium sp.]MBI1197767.1 RDD family protein [Phenylobacterium sp.]